MNQVGLKTMILNVLTLVQKLDLKLVRKDGLRLNDGFAADLKVTYFRLAENLYTSCVWLCVFGCAVDIIDFDIIDFVELILIKSELSEKWFMFGHLYYKSDLYKKMLFDYFVS